MPARRRRDHVRSARLTLEFLSVTRVLWDVVVSGVENVALAPSQGKIAPTGRATKEEGRLCCPTRSLKS